MNYPISSDEPERISALASYRILDMPPEAVFDALTRMLAARTGAPISLISLIDETRQWFKSRHCIGVEQMPRELAFCAHAIMGSDVMVGEDATRDPRFSDNALVVGEPGIRFHAGAPLRTKDGFNLGTVNFVDLKPRTLGADERVMLEDLARIIVEIPELRREANPVVHDERAVERNAEQSSLLRARELQASKARLRDITSNIPGVVYQFRIDPDGQPSFPYVSESIRDLLGLDPADVVRDADTWFDVIHGDDRPDLDASIMRSHASLRPWLWEGRMLRSGGDVGWYRGSSTPRKMDDSSVLWNGLVSTSPSCGGPTRGCAKRKRWRRSANSPAVSHMISTTCSRSSVAMSSFWPTSPVPTRSRWRRSSGRRTGAPSRRSGCWRFRAANRCAPAPPMSVS